MQRSDTKLKKIDYNIYLLLYLFIKYMINI